MFQNCIPDARCKILAQYQVCANNEARITKEAGRTVRHLVIRHFSSFVIRISGFYGDSFSTASTDQDAQTKIAMQTK
jgi:hypothetical protein